MIENAMKDRMRLFLSPSPLFNKNSIRGGYTAAGYFGLRRDLLTQIEKISEPLSHTYTYTAALRLHGMSRPQTCALDV
jgi:hypothetical protein